MRPVSKKTVDTSTRAVRSSTARLDARQRIERSLGNPDDAQALLLEAVELASDAVEFAVGRHEPRPRSEGRAEAAGPPGRGVRRSAIPPPRLSEPGESLANPLGLIECMLRLVVHVARRIEPGGHVAVEAAIRPGLVGVSRQHETLRDADRDSGREGVGEL